MDATLDDLKDIKRRQKEAREHLDAAREAQHKEQYAVRVIENELLDLEREWHAALSGFTLSL